MLGPAKEPGFGGCSFLADQVADLAHLNARGTTLVFASRAPQPDSLADDLRTAARAMR